MTNSIVISFILLAHVPLFQAANFFEKNPNLTPSEYSAFTELFSSNPKELPPAQACTVAGKYHFDRKEYERLSC